MSRDPDRRTDRKRTASGSRTLPGPAGKAVDRSASALGPGAELFLACLPGLEGLLEREVAEAGLPAPFAREPGGLTLPADEWTVVRANLELGLAARVLLRVGEMHCRSLGELTRKTARLPWGRWLHAGRPFQVRAESRKSRLYHRDAIAERVAAGVAAALGMPVPEADAGAPTVLARFAFDRCTLSLDTSGRPLHERGYRLEPGRAPLREDVARALLMASGWDRASPLIDPFAGAGTILIEAALLARRLPPGLHRGFAFEALAGGHASLLQQARAAALARVRQAPPLFGSDRSAEAIAIAHRNAARAGVDTDIAWACAPLTTTPWLAELPRAGAVVSDPPLGRRLGPPQGLVPLYRALGRWLAQAPSGCAIALTSADRRLTLRTGLPLTTAFLVDPGGMKVRGLVRATGAVTPAVVSPPPPSASTPPSPAP